ncbi:hypothetical protein HJFPF1_09764 [Paramyrothecium foliicola]|nr:hypothetical protein HJFPF1_09764 [Paramyrothecium foliicola]
MAESELGLDPDYSGDQAQLILDVGIEPLAQVTVVDAWHGDCNLVDFAYFNNSNSNRYWRRVLIDTGPSYGRVKGLNKQEAERMTNVQCNLIATQSVPRTPAEKIYVPNLAEVQITHLDDDHIGNSVSLLDTLWSTQLTLYPLARERISNCKFVYHQMPRLFIQPEHVILTTTEPKYSKETTLEYNMVEYTVECSPEYKNYFAESDFQPRFVVGLSTKNVQFSPQATGGNFKSGKITLKYQSKDVKSQTSRMAYFEVRLDLYGRGDKGGWQLLPRKAGAAPFTCQKEVPTLIWTDRVAASDSSSPSVPRPKKSDKGNVSVMATTAAAAATTITTVAEDRGPSPDFPINVLSVRQLVDLQSTIAKYKRIGSRTFVGEYEDSQGQYELLTMMCYQKGGQFSQKNKNIRATFSQVYLSPTETNYKALVNYVTGEAWTRGAAYAEEVNYGDKSSAIVNRSSIVTIFNRTQSSEDNTVDTFSMLFTGDAFDQGCDLRSTLAAWKEDPNKFQGQFAEINVDVLKVPHHGSSKTTEAAFYHTVKAQVYLISGAVMPSKHPAWNTLLAIVAGFKGKTRPHRKPFLIFLSSHYAEEDVEIYDEETKKTTVYKSQVKKLLSSRFAPSKVPPEGTDLDENAYYYEIWRTRPKKGLDPHGKEVNIGSCASLSFGHRKALNPTELVVGMGNRREEINPRTGAKSAGLSQWHKLAPS